MIKNEDLQDIINLAESVQSDNNPTNNDLLDIYEGNLKEHIETSMSAEFNANAFKAAKHRIAPINILKRTTDKLAKVYSQGVERSSSNDADNTLITEYEDILDLDNQMGKSDSMVNLLRSVAFEPYIKDEKPRLRILTANQFTVWSNDAHDKKNVTVFIKFMGTKTKVDVIEEQSIDRQVNVYVLYDKDEFLTIDTDMEITERAAHDFKRIPFTYMNLSISKLIPSPDKDSLCMSVLIPKLLSDLNYASKYLSHGIRYGIDVDIANLEGNPDAFWQITSTDKENAKPQIGVLAPSVDIDKVIGLAKEELVMYLESRSLKVGASGQADNNLSGFAKLIDNADVTDVRKENMITFTAAEKDLWNLISIKHNIWITNEEIDVPELNKSFSSEFKLSIKYGDLTPIVDPQEKRDTLKFKLENKLITYERAVRQANPDLTKEEQDTLIEELKLEKTSVEVNEVNSNSRSTVQDKDGDGSEG